MANKRTDQVLVNKNFLLALFAILIVLVIVCAVLLGVVVSNSRSPSTDDNPIPIEDEQETPTPLPETSTDPTASSGAGSYRVNTTANALNMRAQPLANAEIVTTIPKGSIIIVSVVSGEWGYTTYNDASGWVSMSLLAAVTDPTAATPNTAASANG